ncbi:hypothetical protein BpHYR1_021497 [Brachionus plicatilis]|uniref:Uncharacterized protein n=1 Tax=Brachionus plicatilis TaxID=10195 RepID=A0A3M7T2V3_BRAPC|nr:hypothetical protein BpHYR1_021497 [Brachionus plicatilis]
MKLQLQVHLDRYDHKKTGLLLLTKGIEFLIKRRVSCRNPSANKRHVRFFIEHRLLSAFEKLNVSLKLGLSYFKSLEKCDELSIIVAKIFATFFTNSIHFYMVDIFLTQRFGQIICILYLHFLVAERCLDFLIMDGQQTYILNLVIIENLNCEQLFGAFQPKCLSIVNLKGATFT